MSEPLQEQFVESEGFRLRRLFPWVNLFRAFRLAVGLRVMTLGIAAALLLAAGEYVISWMPFSPQMQQPSTVSDDQRLPRTTWPWQPGFFDDQASRDATRRARADVSSLPETGLASALDYDDFLLPAVRTTPTIRQMARSPREVVMSSLGAGAIVLWPARTVIEPAAVLFSRGSTWSTAAVAWCQLIWALLVWSALGVAIVRIIVLEFASRESPSLPGSVRFSLGQLPSAIGSVILPSVALAGLYLVCRLGGLIAYASWLRPIVAAFWIIDLLCGLGIAIILLLLAASWPLIVCAIAVDRGDSFEGFTRAFSYVFGRPWYALWLLVLTTLYGSIVFVFILSLASGAAHLAETAAGGHEGVDIITAETPPILRNGQLPDPDRDARFSSEMGGFWLKLWATAIAGFVASFFWSAAGITYLLLRRSVDATPIDEVHEGDSPSQAATLPLSGVAAAEHREQQLARDAAAEPPPAAGTNESEA
jgi:hypothetical protein